VLPPSDPTHRARLRIFTPGRELPFAGHPTVGTAVLLGRLDDGSAREFVVEESIGPVRCTVEPVDDQRGRARFALPQLPVAAGAAPDDATIAAALGLSAADIGFDALRPSRWSAGNPCTFVPVARLAAVADCRPDAGKIIAHSATASSICSVATAPRPDMISTHACLLRRSA
jgi:trans-2,3-dihydro-3-hydroxyanthranilate isomerase